MSADDAKPRLSPAQDERRRVTGLSYDEMRDGLKACLMLKELARACVAARAQQQCFTPEGLIAWLRQNEFHVEEGA